MASALHARLSAGGASTAAAAAAAARRRARDVPRTAVTTSASSHAARKNPELYALTGGPQRPSSPGPSWPGLQQQLPSPPSDAVGSTGSFSSSSSSASEAAATAAAAAGGTSRNQHKLAAKPEVLAPAGGWPQLRAAVENGADAVYFGVEGFNARARAANFSADELPEVMSYLRARGVKGYVALNVLVFDEELPRLEGVIRQMAAAGVDALIMQDVGAVVLARRVAPNLPIHASTQMSITSAEGAEFAARLGVTRVVVGRELSVNEIAKVAAGSSTEIEAFCHGALCVSYSGQCFSSEAWGGRSANRGQCAQACRMPYALIVDGVIKDLADVSYLLSPQDLAALEQLPAMVAAGVSCFKIEGRLKGPEYVAATTAAYRAGVDAAWEQLQQQQQHAPSVSLPAAPDSQVPAELRARLSQVFARAQDESHGGLTPGFLEGSRHQRLVRGRAPRHRGLCLGRIAGFTSKGGVVISSLQHPVKRGDGLVFDQGTPEQQEQGGTVWDLMAPPPAMQQQQQRQQGLGGTSSSSFNSRQQQQQQQSGRGRGRGRGGRSGSSNSISSKHPRSSGVKWEGKAAAGSSVELLFGPGQVDTSSLAAGDLVWKNRDAALEAALRASYEGLPASAARKLPVQVFVSGKLGSPLTLRLTDDEGHSAAADSGDVLLSAAVKRALSGADVEAAVGKLGDNTLAPANIDMSALDLDAGLFLPASAFKAARRAVAEALLKQRQQHAYADGLAAASVLPLLLATATTATSSSSNGQPGSSSSSPAIRVLCRSPAQVQAALAVPWLSEVIVDFLEVHGLKECVAAVQAAGKQAVVALPRILKPDESRLLWFFLKLGADALLLRGAGCLQQLLELGGPGATVASISALSQWGTTTNTSSSSSSSSDSQPGGVTIPRLEGDFSLNAANVLAADLLLSSGLAKLCPTHDLNAGQLSALAEGLAGSTARQQRQHRKQQQQQQQQQEQPGRRMQQLEAVIHQHLPIFHTEHCVFCRFLSDGNDHRDCGHPCERHTLQLRDERGQDHLVLADMGCRNTVFNASAQSGLYYLPALAACGYGTMRVELVNEPAEQVAPLLETYHQALQGSLKQRAAWQWLQDNCAGGVSGGSLEVKGERAASSLRPSARRT